ncbi:MAG: hypothetical protein HZC55_14815 [Verrucomicrobia bacterium]|nr:hypothetical protein [Verrucomicrobiota bacterium]
MHSAPRQFLHRRPWFARTLRAVPFLVLTFSVSFPLYGQVAITALGTPVLENFDSLGTSATALLPAHWRVTAAGDTSVTWANPANLTATSAQASSGSPTSGGRYNWGQSATDRAIGFMTSTNYASPSSLLAHFSNQTGTTIGQVTVSFDYERYRLNTSAASINFFYSTDGSSWTAVAAGDSGAFSTGASTYGFGTLVSSDTRSFTLDSLNLAAGSSLFLRWAFVTNGSNSQGLGLDNFSLTASAIPEPSTYAAAAGAAALVIAVRRRRRPLTVPVASPPGRSPTPGA